MKRQYLPLANAAMQAHLDRLRVKPKYFLIETEMSDQDRLIATKKGFPRITKGTLPVSETSSSPIHVTILTIEGNIRYCSKCFSTDRIRIPCPEAHCARFDRGRHGSNPFQAGERAPPQYATPSRVNFTASNKIHATDNKGRTKSTDSIKAKSSFGEWPSVGSTKEQSFPKSKGTALPKSFSRKQSHSPVEVADEEQGNARNKGGESLQDISASSMETPGELVSGQLRISESIRSNASLAKKQATSKVQSTHSRGGQLH